MRIRGIPLNFKNAVCHPAATTEYLLVPMVARLSIVADELSGASIARGIERTGKRTSYYEMRFGVVDASALLAFLILLALAFLRL